jgi:hypothetical protein
MIDADKELKKLNGEGIFSVTQLSYTFRPRRSRKTIPTVPDRNFFYLIGLLLIKGGERKVFQGWDDSENDQEKIWMQFIDVIEKLEDFVIYHHGNYDSVFVKKMQDQYGNLNGNPITTAPAGRTGGRCCYNPQPKH